MNQLAVAALLAAVMLLDAWPSLAGQIPAVKAEPAPSSAGPIRADAPPAPVAPDTISRDDEGRATVRAVRIVEPLRIDGRMDEAHYAVVPPMSGFIQIEPEYDMPATDRTDVWVSYDDDKVYASAKMWDDDLGSLVATEMRRDSTTMYQGDDIISFAFDTFHDRRNGVLFSVNPIGGRSDTQSTGERQFNMDWNPVWEVKSGRFEGGWTVELAIPFKSLRYRPGRAQVWGFNVQRIKRSTNEISLLTRVPLGRQQAAMTQFTYAATLVGLEAPPSGRNIDIKPYATSSLTTNRTTTPPFSNDPHAEVGLDVKIAVTEGLTADVTLNTDFAQVEADEQQVNLTRFSLFFPEKREFFVENQGTFAFGGVQLQSFNNQNNSVAPILFYSRRIGLNLGREVPLQAGGRITGRAGRFTLGILNAQTADESEDLPLPARATNFSVVRVRRDILNRSAIGLIATARSVAQNGAGRNLAYGADGSFLFLENLAINTYWAKTETDGRNGDDTSYRTEFNQNGDRYGLQLERLVVGENFNPELGFLQRRNFRRNFGQVRFSPRPQRMLAVRRFRYQVGVNYIEDNVGTLETREQVGEFGIEFENSDQFTVSYTDSYEFLARPFPIPIYPSVVVPPGRYDFQTTKIGFNLGRRRKVSGNMSVEHGTFYDGHRTSVNVSQGRVSLTNALSVEPTYSLNDVDVPEGAFTTHLVGSRITYTMTPLMFVSALVQYNSGTNSVSTNARLRWEYQPGSELFVVYNEDRNTLARSFPATSTRAFIVKVNRLFRF